MFADPVKLLILRPQPGATATAALARNHGLDPVILPLFEIAPVNWAVPDCEKYDALLLTSANAARAVAPHADALRALPVHAVGPATAIAAQAAGFTIASTGQADAQTTLYNAYSAGHRRLLWLAGVDHIALDPPADSQIDIIPVYQSRRVDAGQSLIAAIQDCPVVALHSARAARHFAALLNEAGLDRRTITLAALSPAIAQAAELGWGNLLIAETADDDALLRLVSSSFTSLKSSA